MSQHSKILSGGIVLLLACLFVVCNSTQERKAKAVYWENSLGMKFVPVPGTEVLFSLWDTRVQDYQAFVNATGRKWRKPDFDQGPTHPAVNVSWEDAELFCQWLTKKEHSEGRLRDDKEYRLPLDNEWSVAVGLPPEEGKLPRDKDSKIKGVYPWGTQRLPPLGAGNYSQRMKVDDFQHTSPVGSFAANRFGLYDMGGNVWQWCEDLYDRGDILPWCAVVRGASWNNGPLDSLLSSYRDSYPLGTQSDDRGFRCVVAGVSSSR